MKCERTADEIYDFLIRLHNGAYAPRENREALQAFLDSSPELSERERKERVVAEFNEMRSNREIEYKFGDEPWDLSDAFLVYRLKPEEKPEWEKAWEKHLSTLHKDAVGSIDRFTFKKG